MTLSGENILSPHQYFLDLHVFLFIVAITENYEVVFPYHTRLDKIIST